MPTKIQSLGYASIIFQQVNIKCQNFQSRKIHLSICQSLQSISMHLVIANLSTSTFQHQGITTSMLTSQHQLENINMSISILTSTHQFKCVMMQHNNINVVMTTHQCECQYQCIKVNATTSTLVSTCQFHCVSIHMPISSVKKRNDNFLKT